MTAPKTRFMFFKVGEMNVLEAINSRYGLVLGLSLSRAMHPGIGYRMARLAGDAFASQKGVALVQAVRANQWVIHGSKSTKEELDQLVRETFRSTARSLYEFWHNFRSTKAILNLVEFDPSFEEIFKQARTGKTGTLLVMPHLSNFDLVGRAAVLRGLDLHAITYPRPPGGYKVQNYLRQIQLPGLKLTPFSLQALHEASETLRAGRTVITGIDRPLPSGEDAKYRMHFFGRHASTPVYHIRLAIKHKLPITVVGGIRLGNGHYRIWASEPIPMVRRPDLIEEIVENGERVLDAVAKNIRLAADQWAMFYPVWPEVMDQVSGH